MSATRQDEWTRSFGVDVVPERDVVRLAPSGEIDMATIGTVRERADELIASGFRRVALDLRAVTFLDSSGLRLILELMASAREEGWELGVVEGPRDVQRVFELAGVRELIPFIDAAQLRHARWAQA
jgi:anti-sigma B factor antagonist